MTYTITAQPRDIVGKATKALRRKGTIPAVMYGRGFTSQSVSIERSSFLKLWKQAGETKLIDLVVGTGAPVKVIIADIARDPLSEEVRHVDFHQIRMDEKISTEVELVFTGTPPAVKELGGVLIKSLPKIRISCLPGDLISTFEVDCTALKTFRDYIYIKDLKLPSTIKVLENETEVVATVMAPRSEEELEKDKEKPVEDIGAVERIEKEKKEEEPAEGATTPATPAKKEEKKK